MNSTAKNRIAVSRQAPLNPPQGGRFGASQRNDVARAWFSIDMYVRRTMQSNPKAESLTSIAQGIALREEFPATSKPCKGEINWMSPLQGFDGWFISNDRALPYPDDAALAGLVENSNQRNVRRHVVGMQSKHGMVAYLRHAIGLGNGSFYQYSIPTGCYCGGHLRTVLRDIVARRLKPTVNKVSSLRDFTGYYFNSSTPAASHISRFTFHVSRSTRTALPYPDDAALQGF